MDKVSAAYELSQLKSDGSSMPHLDTGTTCFERFSQRAETIIKEQFARLCCTASDTLSGVVEANKWY
jgi:hypothetical protein